MDSPADPHEVEKLRAVAHRLRTAGKAAAAARAAAAADRLVAAEPARPA